MHSPATPPKETLHDDARDILDALLSGVLVIDPDGYVQRVNGEACRILEDSKELLSGRHVAEIFGPAHRVTRLCDEISKSRRSAILDEVDLERRSRDPLQVDVAISSLDSLLPATRTPSAAADGADRVGLVIELRDRTAWRTLQDDVSRQESLASYGLIATGIAHEVKNPLGGIRGAAELLGLWADEDRAKETAGLIVREVDRITSLVDELMVFARGDALRPEQVNVHQLLDSVLDLITLESAGTDKPDVVVSRIYDPSIPEIEADPDRLRQVFLNLTRNAVQAMGDPGGSLVITTRMTLDHRLVGRDGRPTPTVEVTVEDSGPGIPPEIRKRLATPFFTTRTGGTGLGLAVSQHWITRHGGRMRIESPPGSGALVAVCLPLRLADVESPGAPGAGGRSAASKPSAPRQEPSR